MALVACESVWKVNQSNPPGPHNLRFTLIDELSKVISQLMKKPKFVTILSRCLIILTVTYLILTFKLFQVTMTSCEWRYRVLYMGLLWLILGSDFSCCFVGLLWLLLGVTLIGKIFKFQNLDHLVIFLQLYAVKTYSVTIWLQKTYYAKNC